MDLAKEIAKRLGGDVSKRDEILACLTVLLHPENFKEIEKIIKMKVEIDEDKDFSSKLQELLTFLLKFHKSTRSWGDTNALVEAVISTRDRNINERNTDNSIWSSAQTEPSSPNEIATDSERDRMERSVRPMPTLNRDAIA